MPPLASQPGLAVVLVGDNPSSMSYVRGKTRDAEEVGMSSETIRLPAGITQDELLRLVEELNRDPAWHGVLVQLPLPSHIDEPSSPPPSRPRRTSTASTR